MGRYRAQGSRHREQGEQATGTRGHKGQVPGTGEKALRTRGAGKGHKRAQEGRYRAQGSRYRAQGEQATGTRG